MITDTGFCPYCEKQVLIQRKGTAHILHLFLTIMTCGFWAFIWILCGLNNAYFSDWRCAHCGGIVKKGSTAADYQELAQNAKTKG